MKKWITALSLIFALTLASTAHAYGREHHGFSIEFFSCMAKAKIFVAAPVCVVIAGIDSIVNPPEQYHPEWKLKPASGTSSDNLKSQASLAQPADMKLSEPILPDAPAEAPVPVAEGEVPVEVKP